MMEYYFVNSSQVSPARSELLIDGDEYNHLFRVLRKREGEEISVTDGEGNLYHCVISRIRKDLATCKILGHQYELNEPRTRIRLFISPLKNKERFELAIEKSVELGVDCVIPVITRNTVRKAVFDDSKNERLKKIIRSAMCVSQRCRMPLLSSAVSLEQMIEETKFDMNKIVMYEFSEEGKVHEPDVRSDFVSLLIGPEGGFDESEIEMLTESGWKSRSLGRRKFRSETAAIISVYNLLKDEL